MAYDGAAWNETVPTNATAAHEIDDIARDIKIGVRSRLAVEHVWGSSQAATSSAGYHTYISLQGQTGAPSLAVVAGTTQCGLLYAATDGSLSYIHSSGGSVSLVSAAGTGINSFSSYTASGYIMALVATGAVTTASQGAIYVKSDGTQPEAFYREESSGDEVQITKGGHINQTGFGAWSDVSTAYTNVLALSDGFVSAYATGDNETSNLYGYTDSSATPSTLRIQTKLYQGLNGVRTFDASFLMPVRKGDYWKIVSSGSAAIIVYWIPLGV